MSQSLSGVCRPGLASWGSAGQREGLNGNHALKGMEDQGGVMEVMMEEECVCVSACVTYSGGIGRSQKAEALWAGAEATSEGNWAPPEDHERDSAPGKYRIVCIKEMSHRCSRGSAKSLHRGPERDWGLGLPSTWMGWLCFTMARLLSPGTSWPFSSRSHFLSPPPV